MANKLDQQLQDLEARIDYKFQRPELLRLAITHPSVRRKHQGDHKSEFERLEFLGDRVLGLIIAEHLYFHFSKEKEGDLAKRLAVLVSRNICSVIGNAMGLDQLLQVTGTEISKRTSVLSDAVEALIGAIYLDSNLETVAKIVKVFWREHIQASIAPPKDHKSTLQEWSQQHGLGIPQYEIIDRSGPAHAPVFIIQLMVNDRTVTATGINRRLAEQEAAKNYLEQFT